jgi:Uma2 family endonuclease
MTMVLASTDAVPELAEVIARRHEQGLDTYDEWWDGTYRIVTGPNPEHGQILGLLTMIILPAAQARGLLFSPPVNIGIDKVDARVPDIGIFRPDEARTSPAFLAGAELVVEILSPGETPQAKLDFYARWHVREYVEVDMAARTVTLLRYDRTAWTEHDDSEVLGLTVAELSDIRWP